MFFSNSTGSKSSTSKMTESAGVPAPGWIHLGSSTCARLSQVLSLGLDPSGSTKPRRPKAAKGGQGATNFAQGAQRQLFPNQHISELRHHVLVKLRASAWQDIASHQSENVVRMFHVLFSEMFICFKSYVHIRYAVYIAL